MPQAQQRQQSRSSGQSQKQPQKQITFQQSLESVKTMVAASIGCITWLRGLLSNDNFEDDLVNPHNKGSRSSSQNKDGGLAIKKVKRGHSAEGDRILNYLEKGIFDAVERTFLQSMILAIYIDSNDPSNVIEMYNFNFSYHNVPGVGVMPMLSVEQGMQSMAVGAKSTDPVQVATASGTTITLGDVRKSVNRIVKNLILHTQYLPDLPRTRLMTMKLFYTDDAPEDYEPPLYRPADQDKERFHLGTHATDEIPDITRLTALETGHHGVQITIRSVVEYLPGAHNNLDDTPYGEVSGTAGIETEEGRKADDEKQAADQIARDIMWNAEDQVDEGRDDLQDADAEGESDPELSPRPSVPQPIRNAAFARRVGPGQYKPFPIDDVVRRADRHRRIDDGNEDADQSEPSSQAVMQILARPKKGEGDRGHKVRDSINKIHDLATAEQDSQAFSATQQVNRSSSLHPPSQLPQSFAELDADEPDLDDGGIRSASDDESGDAPDPSRSAEAKAKAKGKGRFQPLMPAHQEDGSITDAQTSRTQQPITRRTSDRLHADGDGDPTTSSSNLENQRPIVVDPSRTKKMAAPSSAPSTGRAKKTARPVRDSDDDESIVDVSQARPKTKPKKSAPKAAPKKKTPVAPRKAKPTGAGKAKGASTSIPKKPAKSRKKKSPETATGSSTAKGSTGKGEGKVTRQPTVWDEADEAEPEGLDPELEKLERHCWCGDIDDANGPEAACDRCDRWMHLYCHGVRERTEVDDAEFICADCELKRDPRTEDWPAAQFDEAIQKFRTLALFRRALRVTYDERVIENVGTFAKRLACDKLDAQMMLGRLADEGFIRRLNVRSNSISSQSRKKRVNFEAVKNETTRKAEKAYFDRSSRAKEDEIWKLDVQADAEQGQSMDLDEEYAHAQPLPRSNSVSVSQPLHRSNSISLSQPPIIRVPTGQLVDLSPNPSLPGAAMIDDDDSQTQSQSQWGHTQMQPARAASPSQSSSSSTGRKRKASEVDAEGDKTMSLGQAMAAAGATGEVGPSRVKRVRAGLPMEPIDVSY